MDVVQIYDYYFFSDSYRTFDDRCEYGLCEKSIVYRRLSCAVEECKKRYVTQTRHAEEMSSERTLNGLSDVLEYMLYNVSGDTGLPAHYSCCMYLYKKKSPGETRGRGNDDDYLECGHVCNAIPIMIGSRLEKKIITGLAEKLGVRPFDLYDADYLHKVYSGSFLVNGTFYYSVFRESNNNKICHNSKSKYRGDETVAYFYDNTCNRGVKVFTNRFDELRVNDRDGNEVTDVTSDVMLQLYKECLHDWRYYTLNMELIKGLFSSVKRQGVTGIDDFKNKIYTNYSIGLNTFLDKLPSTAITSNPMWNSSLMVGKINLGISQRLIYPKSKAETKKQNEQKLQMCTGGKSTWYLIETQRRRKMRKTNTLNQSDAVRRQEENVVDVNVRSGATEKNIATEDYLGSHGCNRDKSKQGGPIRYEVNRKRKADLSTTDVTCIKKKKCPSSEGVEANTVERTILGTKDVKTVGLMERLEQGERNGPSTFNQVAVSYLPLIRVLSNTVQKLQVEHVHAESSKTIPRDAYGFICMKYMGNISTAGKNMLFTQRVQVSYGHVHRTVRALEQGIKRLVHESQESLPSNKCWVRCHESCRVMETNKSEDWLYVVINNAVTVWAVLRLRLLHFIVYIKTHCHRFSWIKVVGNYLCIYYYEGVPLLRYARGDMLFDVLPQLTADGGDNMLDGVDHLYFSRDELEMLATTQSSSTIGRRPLAKYSDLVGTTNHLIDYWLMRSRDDDVDGDGGYDSVENSSLLAKHLDQYTDYTAPAKRSVSVNARKSACINVYYQRAADLIRGFNILVDPEGYERETAKQVAADHGLPEWVTLRDFVRARNEVDNCPQSTTRGGGRVDQALNNFYMLRTIFADMDGHNVEDANVMDASVDLNLSYSYSFSMTFIDRSKKGLDIVIPPPRNAACVCCWDSEGNPTAVLFMVCTIRQKEGDNCSTYDVGEMLRTSPDVRMVNREESGNTKSGGKKTHSSTSQPSTVKDSTCFPPFRKLSVMRSADGNYHVYFMRNDAVLLRSIRKLRETLGLRTDQPVPDMSNATRLAEDAFAFTCKPEVNAYDALTSLRTNITTFESNVDERVVTVDIRVHGRSDKYDGVKVVNSFGQKGLALIKDLKTYFTPFTPASYNVPVQLVMNNCSFVSRQPIGQWLQTKKNMYAVTSSAAGEPTSVGYTPVFFTETEPITKTCLVRFDEMMRSVIITLGMAVFQNLKNSLDNVYNPYGVLYPPQTRQIMSLYRCVGVSYKFSGDKYSPFSSRDDVKRLLDLYDMYTRTPKPGKVSGCETLLRVLDVLDNNEQMKRLVDVGLLKEQQQQQLQGAELDKFNECLTRSKVYILRLNGQCSTGSVQPVDYELRVFDSRNGTYRTVYIYGDPTVAVDTLNDLSPSTY